MAGDGQKKTPVIFVAINYRVNGQLPDVVSTEVLMVVAVFGFANTSALAQEGGLNSGLLDQHLALQSSTVTLLVI